MSKKQENKYDPSLTSYELIKAISDVRQYGIDKHGYRDEWFTTHPNEHFKSAMRHLIAAINGEEYDVSGLPHIAHAVTNLAFELERGNYAFNRKYENEKEKDKHSRQLNLHL